MNAVSPAIIKKSMPPCFRCELCNKGFCKRYNLNRHNKIKHSFPVVFRRKRRTDYKCGLCEDIFTKFKDFKDHLPLVHDIKLKSQELEFKTDNEFKEWKQFVEEQETASYVKHQASSYYDLKIGYYQCHRSGYFRETVKPHERQRQIKIQGTSKINAYCPARIKSISSSDGSVYVEYCSTHVGHNMDLAHLNVPVDERKKLATKIAAKIPFEAILDDVQTSVNDRLQRSHLITKQDLRNIARDFSLDSPRSSDLVDHSNDTFSADAWVEKERSSDNNCIIFYKPESVDMPQYPTFKNEDFMLGVMTEAQAEVLKKYGSDSICMASTGATGAGNYEMTTLLVLDDMRQGFPCALFFSNRNDQSGIEHFLSAVRDRVGAINCKVLMTEMAEIFYSSWKSVMGDSEKRLSCTLHVKRSWHKRISSDKMEHKSKLKDTSDKIYAIHGVNTNMHLEGFYSVIKHLHVKWEAEKSIDKSINSIMRFINQKLFDRLLVLEKGKITYKLRNLRQRHKTSLTISLENVILSSDDSWSVLSSSSSEMYNVQRDDTNCSCSLICQHCKACIHNFKCTCIDSSIRWNMCKHIHLVCRMLVTKGTVQSLDEIPFIVAEDHCYHRPAFDKPDIHIEKSEKVKEKNVILKTMRKNIRNLNNFNLDILKKKISDEYNLIISKVTCIDQVNLMESNLRCLKPLLASVEEGKDIENFLATTEENDPQSGFIITKEDDCSKAITELILDESILL